MFGLAEKKTTRDEDDLLDVVGQPNVNLLSEFCVVDHWSANLANAMLKMGDQAKTFHQLDPARERFGLLEFVRCYDGDRQRRIIQLFEHAAFENRPFHFTATLGPPDSRRAVQCFGSHRTVEGTASGEELFGLFVFSRDLYTDL
ncbi:hypothetical protein [Pararhizobium haloflavum]|uniref:hypothetical protein n=1 Tax=Pararhizobium haloflavum TaxID=2037914 RepID=UPI000C1962B6|nr:hypothetical protein [Pararhizobium haloflavum]